MPTTYGEVFTKTIGNWRPTTHGEVFTKTIGNWQEKAKKAIHVKNQCRNYTSNIRTKSISMWLDEGELN